MNVKKENNQKVALQDTNKRNLIKPSKINIRSGTSTFPGEGEGEFSDSKRCLLRPLRKLALVWLEEKL